MKFEIVEDYFSAGEFAVYKCNGVFEIWNRYCCIARLDNGAKAKRYAVALHETLTAEQNASDILNKGN